MLIKSEIFQQTQKTFHKESNDKFSGEIAFKFHFPLLLSELNLFFSNKHVLDRQTSKHRYMYIIYIFKD